MENYQYLSQYILHQQFPGTYFLHQSVFHEDRNATTDIYSEYDQCYSPHFQDRRANSRPH